MEDRLNNIWNKLQEAQEELKIVMNKDNSATIFEKLKTEEKRQRQFEPFKIPILIMVILPAVFIIYTENGSVGLNEILGLICVFASGLGLMYLPWSQKIRFHLFQYDQPATRFLESAKKVLLKRRQLLLQSLLFQSFALTTGLYFLIFAGREWTAETNTTFLFFLGFMLVLAMITISLTILGFNQQYKEIFKRTEEFVE